MTLAASGGHAFWKTKNILDEHTPYEQIRHRPCDFIVKYKFYTDKEGGRKTGTPIQGYRSDFMYVEDEVENKQECKMWMIHPEFLDKDNKVILDKTIRVPQTGKAQMWILNERLYEMHQKRVKVGQKGYFMEGRIKTAECEVIEIVALKNINTTNKTIVITADNFSTLEGFFDEIDNLLTQGLDRKTGHNLDAFNDLLRGGFGVNDYEEPINLVWRNSKKSKQDLNIIHNGQTLYEILIEIISGHEHIKFSEE